MTDDTAVSNTDTKSNVAIGLEAMRRWLYIDAKIDGLRSTIAGLVAPASWFIFVSFQSVLPELAIWAFFPVLGLILAVLMFFAWLTPTPVEMRERKSLVEGSDHGP